MTGRFRCDEFCGNPVTGKQNGGEDEQCKGELCEKAEAS